MKKDLNNRMIVSDELDNRAAESEHARLRRLKIEKRKALQRLPSEILARKAVR